MKPMLYPAGGGGQQPPAPPPPTGGVQPQGMPVSSAVTVQAVLFKQEATRALSLIDSIHTDGALPPITIKAFPFSRNYEDSFGAYLYSELTGEAQGIELNTTALFFFRDHVASTVVHETGHFIDHQGVSTAREFASNAAINGMGVLSEWFDAVHQSREVSLLRVMAVAPANFAVNHPILGPILPEPAVLHYLLEPAELWARAYTQYIAVKTSDKELLDQIEASRLSIYGIMQWEGDTFKPIEAAIDRLFAAKGWTK